MQGRMLLIALLALLTGCTGDELSPDSSGKELYGFYCASCHGIAGEGSMLFGAPSTLGRGWGDEAMINWLLKADNHQHMPAFARMMPESARRLAHYLQSLEEE